MIYFIIAIDILHCFVYNMHVNTREFIFLRGADMGMTMKEIAGLAGVSRFAVSAVLSDSKSTRVSVKTKEKILRLAEKYNFVPNLAAKQLKGGSSNLIGLISVPSYRGLVAVLQSEIITILQSRGFEVLTAHLNSGMDQSKVINELRARQVNGIIGLEMNTKIIQQENAPMPIVYCSHTSRCGFDVGCDIGIGGYLAAKHLLRHGRMKLVYLGLDSDVFNSMKYAGVCKAMEEAGMKVKKDNLLTVESGSSKEILDQLWKRRADALICCNDFAAADMLKVLQQNGIKVPDDLAVTGFDGYSFCKYTPVSLATVVQPISEQAQHAVELLLNRINERKSSEEFSNIKLPPVFQPGGSCGCPEPGKDVISGDAFILLSDVFTR